MNCDFFLQEGNLIMKFLLLLTPIEFICVTVVC